MDTAATLIRQHWYSAQIVIVVLLTSLVTFVTVRLAMLTSPWHSTWMVVLPFALGILLNRGMSRLLMASVLLTVSFIATMVIGNAMGGI